MRLAALTGVNKSILIFWTSQSGWLNRLAVLIGAGLSGVYCMTTVALLNDVGCIKIPICIMKLNVSGLHLR